jgi:DNA-binding PadR family transcriptional regulator
MARFRDVWIVMNSKKP